MEFEEFRFGDNGDLNDSLKWDFDESVLKKVRAVDGYDYLLNDSKNLNILVDIRNSVNRMCEHIYKNMESYDESIQNVLKLFLSIHGEFPTNNTEIPEPFKYHWIQNNGITSRVMYSEIPNDTIFDGLNKPKDRYINNQAPSIGKDKQLRPSYRHLFFKIPNNATVDSLKNLVIHELAHTAANHSRWRNDDHGKDFQTYEKILKDGWSSKR
jgi:hypothetical protein